MKCIKFLKAITFSAVMGVLSTVVIPASANAVEIFTIGTGGVTGVYYPAGGAICRLFNGMKEENRQRKVRCTVESTGGSVDNILALRARSNKKNSLDDENRIDVAIVQSDWQYNAYNGTGPEEFKQAGPFKDLRSLFSLHTEAFTLVVRADSKIKTLNDLQGKKVNIGNMGSGNRATMEVVMAIKGWTKNNFKEAVELKGSDQPQALCDGTIDAMVYSAGHPNGAVQEAATSCNVRIVTIDDPQIDKLVKENSYYAYTTIPGGMYAGNPNDIKTFGVKATVVTSVDLDEDLAYSIVKSVFSPKNFKNFKTLHPVFVNLDRKSLVKEGNTAPLHPGAVRYFKEVGLL